MNVQVNYDQTVDAAYIRLENQTVLDSEEIADGIIIDYDKDNKIVGVELLGLKTINPKSLDVLIGRLPQSVKTKVKEGLNSVNPLTLSKIFFL